MENKRFLEIILRYFFLLFFALFFLDFFYTLIKFPTLLLSSNILNLFFDISINNSAILIENYSLELVPACLAGSAYLLLLILNLSTPMNTRKRILSISYAFLTLFLLNSFRIVFMAILLLFSSSSFVFFHKFFWYFVSTILVVLIWFSSVKIFKITSIPFYTDIKEIKKYV